MYSLGASPLTARLMQKAQAARPPATVPRATVTLPTIPISRGVVAQVAARAVAPMAAARAADRALVAQVAPHLPTPSSPVGQLIRKAQGRPGGVFTNVTKKARARIAARPPGSTGPVPVSPVEQVALNPPPPAALPMPASSPFSLVTSSAAPTVADLYPASGLYEQESQALEDLAPSLFSDVPDWMVDTAYQSPAATDPQGGATMEPAGQQLDPLDELEQYEDLAQGGDISQRELDQLKTELAQRSTPPPKVPWYVLAAMGGLLLWSYTHRRSPPGGWR